MTASTPAATSCPLPWPGSLSPRRRIGRRPEVIRPNCFFQAGVDFPKASTSGPKCEEGRAGRYPARRRV